MTTPTSESGYTYAKGWGTCCNGNIIHSGSFQRTGSEVWINANGISLSFQMNMRYNNGVNKMLNDVVNGINYWPVNLDLFDCDLESQP